MAAQNPDRKAATLSIPEWDQWMADHPDVPVIAPDGTVFDVAPPERWPDGVLEAIEDEKPVAAVRLLLGKRYDAWTKTGANSAYLLVRIGELAGMTPGESSASPS